MQWKENYSTGNEEIDEQHKTLFAFSDDFRSSLEDGFGLRTYEGYVEFLSVYSKTHFDFEDKCMLAHKCPVAPRNRAEHKTFAKLVTEENEAYQKLGFERDRALQLLNTIDNWLDSHICRIDVQLKDYPEQ